MECVKKYPLVSNGTMLNMDLTKSLIVDAQEETSYTTYGICLGDESGTVLYECRDISTSRAFVEKFITLCAENDVGVLHVRDLLEDYIYTDSAGAATSGRWYW